MHNTLLSNAVNRSCKAPVFQSTAPLPYSPLLQELQDFLSAIESLNSTDANGTSYTLVSGDTWWSYFGSLIYTAKRNMCIDIGHWAWTHDQHFAALASAKAMEVSLVSCSTATPTRCNSLPPRPTSRFVRVNSAKRGLGNRAMFH